jgi:uncharacterized membrane protein
MFVWAIRSYEPWTVASLLASTILLVALVAVVILAVQRRNR